MYNLKGFVTIESMASNVPGEVSPIGELSPYSQTYSKDIGIYSSDVNRLLELHSFYSKSSTVGNIQVPQVFVDSTLEIINWTYQQRIATSVQITKSDFLTALTAHFQSDYTNLNCGNIIQSSSGYWFPEWINYKRRSYSDDNLVTIWLSDQAFRLQYDIYEIVVIPPLMPVDAFQQPYASVLSAVNATNFTDQINRIQTARGHFPETMLTASQYNYVDPLNPNNKISVTWAILIYGLAGNDSDKIKNSIISYILANSSRPQSGWVNIFPDLFLKTEFLILPRWNNVAILNNSLNSGVYSSVINFKKELDYLKLVFPNVAPAHIDTNAQCMASAYNSIMLDIIGSIENRDSKFKITSFFPDIINVPTTSLDFNRMNLDTQKLLILLGSMLPVAEIATATTELPTGMSRTLRGSVLYISASFKDVNFLVAAKSTLPVYA